MPIDPLAAAGLLGVSVGVLMGLTGAGGGILSVPLLVFAFKLQIAQASPIALLTIAITASIGAAVALKRGELRYRAALLMAIFGICLSPLGLWLSRLLPNTLLTWLFSAVLLYVSIAMFVRTRGWFGADQASARPPCLLNESIGRLIWTLPCARALARSGATAGFLSGLLGVGGGFILVPALQKHTDLPVSSIVATSLGVLALVTGASFIGASFQTPIRWPIALPFATGAVLGMLAGGVLKFRMSEQRIREIFALLAFVIAILFAAG
jgi:uncharacterized protein